MAYEEKTIDCLILGILKNEPTCNLSYISQQLKLPKTEIMRHIRYLCENGYLYYGNNGFYTTHNGNYIAVEQDDISFTNDVFNEEDISCNFSWENCRYIPSQESFSRKNYK